MRLGGPWPLGPPSKSATACQLLFYDWWKMISFLLSVTCFLVKILGAWTVDTMAHPSDTSAPSQNVQTVWHQGQSVPKTVRHHAVTMHNTGDARQGFAIPFLVGNSQIYRWFISTNLTNFGPCVMAKCFFFKWPISTCSWLTQPSYASYQLFSWNNLTFYRNQCSELWHHLTHPWTYSVLDLFLFILSPT